MVAPTQEEFEDCCCEGEPCSDCADDSEHTNPQPSTVVTVNGDCTERNKKVEGEWSWNEYILVGENRCYWTWNRPEKMGSWGLHIVECVASGRWYAFMWEWESGDAPVYYGGNVAPDCFPFETVWKEITGLVTCNKTTKKLAGEFDLDSGTCTANVTLGG